MKVLIISRKRGATLSVQCICVREVCNEVVALSAYPYIRKYERLVFESKNEIRYYSPAAIRWYNNRNIGDSFKTIYLMD